jgi:hypothetical protein
VSHRGDRQAGKDVHDLEIRALDRGEVAHDHAVGNPVRIARPPACRDQRARVEWLAEDDIGCAGLRRLV